MDSILKHIKYHKNFIFIYVFLIQSSVFSLAEEGEPPSLTSLSSILSRIVGLFLAASAAALIIMVAYGIIKGSLAAGDPRGLEGAKSTWTYALYGFLIIVLSMVILTLIRKVLGLSTGDERLGFKTFLDKILDSIEELVGIGQRSGSGPQGASEGYLPVTPIPK